MELPLKQKGLLPILRVTFGDVPKLVRGESAKLLFISSSLIVASKSKTKRPLEREVFLFLDAGTRPRPQTPTLPSR